MNKKHIVIIGLGGVGGYFGFKVNQANERDKENYISFVARDETYKAVEKNGLTLHSPEYQNNSTRPDAICKSISEIKSPDLIFICVKEYDLESVCRQLQKVISSTTILFPLMNGVDIYDRIKTQAPQNVVLPSCVYVASHSKEKGMVEHKGKPGKIIFGKDPEHFSEDSTWVEQVLDKSKIDYECKDSALTDIWEKYIFIASFGLVSARHNSSIGMVCSNQLQSNEAVEIMKEIQLIAGKKGIKLSEDIIAKTFEKAATFPPETPTSLQLDINSGKAHSELELFAGAIIKYGAEVNVACPHTQKIYHELKDKQHTFYK